MEKIHAEIQIGSKKLRIIQGDLTQQNVDAIVNAANCHLQHGGGVAGAIVRKGGAIIQDESDRIGFTPVGTAVITTGGSLKARWVIHTVGPRWGEGDEDRKLENAILSSLALAEERNLETISLPAVSAGIFGFPHDRCAKIIVSSIISYLKDHPGGSLKSVDVCLLRGALMEHFVSATQKISAMQKT